MADVSNSKLFDSDTGILGLKDVCVVLVRTEWNNAIVDELEKGCIEELQKKQSEEDRHAHRSRGCRNSLCY